MKNTIINVENPNNNNNNKNVSSTIIEDVKIASTKKTLPPLSSVFFLALAIFLVFFCFLPAQTFAAVVFPQIGSLSVSLLYMVFLIGVIFSPTILKKYDVGISVAIGSALYLPFAIAVCIESEVLLVIGCCSCGFGASLLWNGVGMLLTLLSDQKTRGRRSAIFAAVNRLNFTSNIVLGIGLATGASRSILFIFIIGFGIFGTIFLGLHAMLITRPLSLVLNKREEIKGDAVEKTVLKNTRDALMLYTHKDYQPYLLTNFLIYGIVKGWLYAELTTWVKDVGKDQAVAFLVGTYGIFLVLSGLIHGKIFDFYLSKSWKIAIFLSPLLIGAVGMIIAFTARLSSSSSANDELSDVIWFYVASALIGASSGGVESCGYAITSFLYPEKEKTAIAVAAKLYVEVFGQVVGFLFPTIFQKNVIAQVIFFIIAFALNGIIILRYLVVFTKE